MASSIVLPPGISASLTDPAPQLITSSAHSDILVLAVLLAGGLAYATHGIYGTSLICTITRGTRDPRRQLRA